VVEILTKAPKAAQRGEPVCHNEGWRWAKLHGTQYQGYNPDLPTSVYCVLRKGHVGKHASKPRAALFGEAGNTSMYGKTHRGDGPHESHHFGLVE